MTTITMQISPQIPVKLWDEIKKVAYQEGTTATAVLTRALRRELGEIEKETGFELGDRISAEDYNSIGYTNFLVAQKEDTLGIYCRDGFMDFRPLTFFRSVEKLSNCLN